MDIKLVVQNMFQNKRIAFNNFFFRTSIAKMYRNYLHLKLPTVNIQQQNFILNSTKASLGNNYIQDKTNLCS